jgi:hypothetical protein
MFVPQEQRQHGPGIKVGAIESTINAAEKTLRLNGWVNGHPRRTPCPQTCMGIALAMHNQTYDVDYFRVHDLMLQAAHIQTGKRWRDIPQYNDAKGRTVEDVWGVFQIARELAAR